MVKNPGPPGGTGPRSESPEPSAVTRGPCTSPCWHVTGRLPLQAAGALAWCPPLATALATAGALPAAACGFPTATAGTFGERGGPPTSAAAGGFPAAACGFPTATAGTSRERGGPPTSATAAGFASVGPRKGRCGLAFAWGGCFTGHSFGGMPLGSETAPAKHVPCGGGTGGALTGGLSGRGGAASAAWL